MTTQPIRTAAPAEADPCIAVITLAFSSDPGIRWMYPDPRQYLDHFPAFVRAFGGGAFAEGAAHYVEGFRAAALWLPPGVSPDEEALGELLVSSVPAARREAAFSLMEQLGAFHPHEPHWHLPLIGTDPRHQGRGHGAALLAHGLATCDEQQMPAYLEATSERSVPLYRKHGFEVLDTLRVGDSPPLFPMVRKPR